MLPQVGDILGAWKPTRMQEVENRTTFMGKPSIWKGMASVSTLSSIRPGHYRGHSPVTGGNDEEDASAGHAEWLGQTLTFSGEGRRNYYFLPGAPNKVSFCVLLPDTFAIGGYIVSDDYAGCEYHIAINKATMELALMHVYKGSSGLAKYSFQAGWELLRVLKSGDLVKKLPIKADNAGQLDGSILSISYIPPCRLFKDFDIQSDFIAVTNAGRVTHTLS
jgi:hypothetical protein